MRALSILVTLLFFLSTLSGCIFAEEKTEKDSVSVEPLYFEDGEHTCFEHDNETRCWLAHVPDNLENNALVPLIVDLHGYAGTSTLQKSVTDFDNIADEYGAIVVYPDGSISQSTLDIGQPPDQAWNAGWCCGTPALEASDDIGFLLKMVDIVSETHPIDTNRIYVTGWSNGCAMAQYLAMKASDVFAAVGCMSFYLLTDYDSTYSPIPIMEVHGFLDQVVLYESSVLSVPTNSNSWTDPEAVETGAIENMYEWAGHNECTGSVQNFEVNPLYSVQGFDNCQNGTQVRLMTIYAAQHNPYAKDTNDGTIIGSILVGTQGLVQTSYIVWDFMNQFSKETEN